MEDARLMGLTILCTSGAMNGIEAHCIANGGGMRAFGLLAWLTLPILVGAYRYGPGQEKLKLDDVSPILAEPDQLARQYQWSQASSRYEQALALLPPGRVDEARRIRLQRAK